MAKQGPELQGRHGGNSVKPGNVSSVVANKIEDQWVPWHVLAAAVVALDDVCWFTRANGDGDA